MKNAAFALALLIASAAAPARALDAPIDIVKQSIAAINRYDMTTFASLCTKDAVALDNFPPHVWVPNGCMGWGTGYVADMKADHATTGKFTLGKPFHNDVTRDRAYIVLPATFTYRENGKPGSTHGLLTYVLKPTPAGWRIIAWIFSEE